MAGRDLQRIVQQGERAATLINFVHSLEILINHGISEDQFATLLQIVREYGIVSEDDCIAWMGIDSGLWERWVTYEEVPDDDQQQALAWLIKEEAGWQAHLLLQHEAPAKP